MSERPELLVFEGLIAGHGDAVVLNGLSVTLHERHLA